jgi:hypothetical protein
MEFSSKPRFLYECIESSFWNQCDDTIHVDVDAEALPAIDLEINENETYILRENYRNDLTFTTLGTDDHILTSEQIGKIPHDMVLSCFCEILENDSSLGYFFERHGEHTLDSPTPDFLGKIPGNFVLEVGTSRSATPDVAFDHKMMKYMDVCQERNLKLFIITVCTQSVRSNFKLTHHQAELINKRYKIGLKIQERAEELGWQFDENTEDTANIGKSIDEYNVHRFEDPLCMDMDEIHDYQKRMNDLDPSKISDIYDDLFSQSREILKSKIGEDEKDGFRGFIDEVNKIGKRIDNKSVAPICLFSLDKDGSYPDSSDIPDDSSPYSRFWSSLNIDDIEDDGYDYESNKYYHKTKEEESSERSERKETIRSKDRANIDLSEEDKEFFAERGLNGSRYKESAFKKESEALSRESFSFDVDLSDIDEFVDSFDDHVDYRLNPYFDHYSKLIEMSEDRGHSTQFVEDLLNTKIGSCLSCHTSIFSEINLQRRKPTTANQWIVRRHPSLPCIIAVHNTKIGNHVFYTVCFKKSSLIDKYGKPFSNLIEMGNMICTPLLSTGDHDISHHISSVNSFISIATGMCEVWGHQKIEGLGTIPCKQEIMATLLTYLENKDSCSAPLFNVRYMYMSMIVPKILKCDPFKVLSKFPTVIRGRSLIWHLKKMFLNFGRMLNNRAHGSLEPDLGGDEAEDDDIVAKDKIPGLLSYISGKEIPSLSCAISLSYIGTFHNPDKSVKIHGFLKIFSKVLKEEMKVRDTTTEAMKGLEQKPLNEYKSHEFNEIHIDQIMKAMKRHWKKKGLSFKQIKRKIHTDLSRVKFSDLSTFKASANNENFDGMESDPKWDNYEQKRRNKAMMEVYTFIKEMEAKDSCPFTDMNKVVSVCRDNGGIVANLFKKNQPTGPREIFVLTMCSRIMIKFLETISRSLCECCDNEYLTKGKQKKYSTRRHYKKTRDKMPDDSKSVTCSDSADATTWCQRFVMPVFQKMFATVFDEWDEILPVITDILNHVTVKKLEMPMELLDLFKEHKSVYGFDEGMNELKRQFLGESTNDDLVYEGSVLLRNRSNFMQGILHYTSSLLHAAHCIFMEEFCENMIFKPLDMKVVQTSKVSSDDCSWLRSLIYGNDISPEDLGSQKLFLLLASTMTMASYPLMGAENSDTKSSLMIMCSIEEFNSYWTVVNTSITPLLKWCYSSQMIQTENDFDSRMNTCYNMLSDLLENGAHMDTCSDIEFGMSMNHYNLMGMYTTKREEFSKLIEDIKKTSCPSIGFFPYSHSKIGPALGYSFTKWYNLKKSRNARKSAFVTQKKMFGLMTEDGDHTFHYSLPIGNSKNYHRFIEELGFDRETICDQLELNPSMFFGDEVSIDDSDMMIKIKAMTSGAAKAFSFNSPAKQHSVSAYINTRPCISFGIEDGQMIKGTLPFGVNYVSSRMNDREIRMESIQDNDYYNRIIEEIEAYRLVPYSNMRRKISVSVKLETRTTVCSLREVLQKVWFSMPVRKPRFMIDRSLEYYKAKYPWIKSSFNESFDFYKENIGDLDILSFCEGINNVCHRDRTVSFLHTGRRKIGKHEQLMECLACSQRTGSRGVKKTVEFFSSTMFLRLRKDLLRIESRLYKLATSPPGRTRDKFMMEGLRFCSDLSFTDLFNDDIINQLTNKERSLFCLVASQQINDSGLSIEDQFHYSNILLGCLKNGVYNYYIQEQKRNENGEYCGAGIIGMKIYDLDVRLRVQDDTIRSVDVTDVEKFKRYITDFTMLLRKLNMKKAESDGSASHFRLIYNDEGRVSLSFGKLGCYVNKVRMITSSRNVKFDVEIFDHGSLKLNLKFGKLSGDGVRFRADRIDDDEIVLDSDVYHSWCNRQRANTDVITKILNNSKTDEKILKWLIETLTERMRKLNMMPESLYIAVPGGRMEDEIEISDEELMAMYRAQQKTMDYALTTFNAQIFKESESMDMREIQMDQEMTKDLVEQFGYTDDYDNIAINQEGFDIDRTQMTGNNQFWDTYIDDHLRKIINDKSMTYSGDIPVGDHTKLILGKMGFRETIVKSSLLGI